MILVDTSVWIQHLHAPEVRLQALLEASSVACHPMVLGELSCGRIARRTEFLGALAALPMARSCEDSEVMNMVERRHLFGSGIGWIDAHLLAAALTHDLQLWTLDASLRRAAFLLRVHL